MQPITRTELAAHLGISPRTLNRWLRKEGIKLKPRRISEEDLKIILEAFGIDQRTFFASINSISP